MKLINLALLLLLCSCVDPSSLDELQNYAETKLEHNIQEFSNGELKKWWDDYFKSQAMLILANGKAFETTVRTISRLTNNDQRNNYALLNDLIKLNQLNLSLKTLTIQSREIERNWKSICGDNQVTKQIGLRNSILNNYINGLKLPTMAETYMIGGGDGEDGLTKMFESITTNIGSLFSHDRMQRIKKKIKKIKAIFREKTPTEDQLSKLSSNVCLASATAQLVYLEELKSLIHQMSETSRAEWRYYQEQKSIIGNLLLKKNLFKTDKILEEKLGHIAKNNLLANLAVMRQHLLQLSNKVIAQPTVDNKETLQDFLLAFDSQLNLITTLPYDGLNEVVETNLRFINRLRARNL
ncbi:MAG: hypothetical protein NDI69_16680 [Bacteriovoracaceae bacterium]|nr:hypothetical protein [Bacteriovoracaceae bacterium]